MSQLSYHTSQSIWCWHNERQTTDIGNLICSIEGNPATWEHWGIKVTKLLGQKLEGTSFRMLNGVSSWIKHKTMHKLLINVGNVLRNTGNNYEKCQTQPSWHLAPFSDTQRKDRDWFRKPRLSQLFGGRKQRILGLFGSLVLGLLRKFRNINLCVWPVACLLTKHISFPGHRTITALDTLFL